MGYGVGASDARPHNLACVRRRLHQLPVMPAAVAGWKNVTLDVGAEVDCASASSAPVDAGYRHAISRIELLTLVCHLA